MAEGVILRSSFGRSIKSPRHGSSGKGFGFGTVDIRPAGLEGHYRTNLEKILDKMGQHVEQSMIIMAKMEYTELMNIEKKLKESNTKLFQKTSEARPKPNNYMDEMWGPKLFHIIQKSRETQFKNMSDDALRELNALQRSAKAYDEAKKSSADGSPREIKMIPNLSGSVLIKRKPSSGNTPRSHPHGSPMKAIHPVHVSTKALHPDKTEATKKPDLRSSFIRSPSQDSNTNRSASKPASQGYKSVHRGGSISISREEYDRLQRKVKQQEIQIDELTTRLSSFASKQLLDGNPHMADLSDKNRPTKIGEKFGELYDEEWSDAFDAFQTQLKYTEEKCLRVLLRILRYAYDFCKKTSESQLQELILSMKMHVLDPVPLQNKSPANSMMTSISQVNLQLSGNEGKALQSVCHRHSKDFRKAAGPKSVPALQEVFKEQILRRNFQLEPRQLPKPILAYIDACVEITWLMCIQDPPMVITWATEGEEINTNYYKLYQTSGNIVKTSVWPVLLLHTRGPIVSKGYVLPQKR